MGHLTTGHYIALAITLPTAVALLYLLYKRHEEDEVSEQQIATGRQKIIEVKVPRNIVGAIIGRQGCHIKDVSIHMLLVSVWTN
ncbi:tudor and KH domain-containing protein-like [Saccoglossus kowalevskii]